MARRSHRDAENPSEPTLIENEGPTVDSIYDYYVNTLGPAFLSSLPLLAQKLSADVWHKVRSAACYTLPTVVARSYDTREAAREFVLRHLDANQDGSISSEDFLNELMELIPTAKMGVGSWAAFVSKEWPLLEWKVGVWLWRTFGTALTILAILTVVPGRLHGWSGRILRWPILGITYLLVTVELIVYIAIRVSIWAAEYFIARPKHRHLRSLMSQSKSYEEWYSHAQELDESQGRDQWIRHVDDQTSLVYNWTFVKELLADLRQARKKGDAIMALAVIQQCTRKNVGGIMSEDLFCYTNTGEPKAIVKEFIHEVVSTLRWLTDEALSNDAHGDDNGLAKADQEVQKKMDEEKDKLWKSLISLFDPQKNNTPLPTSRNTLIYKSQVLQFLKRARASYGRTALCLSGGSMMGAYHFGHVRGLLETGCLPHIISGTSAGSIIGAILCTRTDEELDHDMRPEVLVKKLICFSRKWPHRISSLLKTGSMFSEPEWLELLRWFTKGDTTFAEAYQRTGRVFCITLSSTVKKAPPVLINYLSAPDVTIASAILASAAVPGFIPPVRLRVKDKDGFVRFQGSADETYYDGSIKQDIPTNGLAEMLNCQFHIACQCNPHINIFFFNSKGGVGRPSRWSSGEQEDSWRGGFLLAALEMYLKNDMKAKMVFLRDLDAAVGFTSELMTQDFMGSTTIVPQTRFSDYLCLLDNPTLDQLRHCFQAGSVAAYEHTVMIQMHFSIADSLEECIDRLEPKAPPRRSRSKLGPRLPSSIKVTGIDTFPKMRQTTSHGSQASSRTSFGSAQDEFEGNWVDLH